MWGGWGGGMLPPPLPGQILKHTAYATLGGHYTVAMYLPTQVLGTIAKVNTKIIQHYGGMFLGPLLCCVTSTCEASQYHCWSADVCSIVRISLQDCRGVRTFTSHAPCTMHGTLIVYFRRKMPHPKQAT